MTPKNSVHPIISERSKYKHLHWRRERGGECAICPYVIDADEEYAGRECKELEEEFSSDNEKFENFLRKREEYIEVKNGKGIIGSRNRKQATQKEGKVDKTVTAASVEKYKASIKLGNIWPVKLYESPTSEGGLDKKANPKEVRTYTVQGRKYRGILLNSKFG